MREFGTILTKKTKLRSYNRTWKTNAPFRYAAL